VKKSAEVHENKEEKIRDFWRIEKECGSKRKNESYFGLGRSGGKKSLQVIENTRGENGV
jgi:hypothetical protein